MRFVAKASSAGSTQRQATGLGRIFRGALATRDASLSFDGSGAPSHGRALVARGPMHPAALAVATFLLLGFLALAFVSSAQAGKVVVEEIGSTTTGTLGGQFSTPRGIAVNQNGTGNAAAGDFFVVDGANHRVQQFDASGNFVRAWGADVSLPAGGTTMETCTVASECKAGITTVQVGGAFNQPQGIAIDQSDGAIYVTDQGNRRVQKFTLPVNPADPVVFDRAFGWDVITNGSSSDPGNVTTFQVCTVAADCKIGAAAGEGGGQFGAFVGYPAVVPGPGEILVADMSNRRVQRFEADGDFLYAFGFDVDSAGLVGQLEKCTTTCRAGTPAGTAVGQFPNNQPNRVAADSSGFTYTVESASPFRVQRFNPAITSAVAFSSALVGGADTATSPTNVYVNSSNDNLYVTKGVVDAEDVDADGNTTEVLERRILQVDAGGNQVDVHGAKALLPALSGLAVKDSGGRIYASATHRVFILDNAIPPTATIDPVTIFGATTATFTGSVDPEGLQTGYHFEYSKDNFATKEIVPLSDADAGPVDSSNPIQQNATGLEPNTTYEVRLVATTSGLGGGTVTTPSVSFTTDPAQPEIVSIGTFPGEADTSVILFASIDPQSSPTTYRFEYGPTAAYEQSTSTESMGSGAASEAVFARVNDLEPGATYHFKAVATNPSGTVESADATFTLPSSSQCPNLAFRVGPSAALPDCRAYEMVSPLDKNGGDIDTATEDIGAGTRFGSSYRQASIEGGEITYSSATSFGDAVGGHWSNQYLSSRGPEGWSTHGISARRWTTVFEPVLPIFADFRWFTRGFFQGFTPDLSSAWIRDDNVVPLGPGALEGYVNIYRRDNLTETYEPLTNEGPYGSNVRVNLGKSISGGGPRFLGASEDLRHQVFAVNAPLTPDAFVPSGSQITQLYDLVDGKLHLVSVLPNGAAATTESFVGDPGHDLNVVTQWHTIKNAVSDDGSRIFWSAVFAGNSRRIYARENSGEAQSAIVDGECTEPEKACTIPVSESVSPDASQFWAAAADGSTALFSQGAHPSRSLYLFDAETRTPTQIAGQSAGVSATSEDLSHIYFVSREAKAPGAVAGDSNLYHYHDGTYALIGAVTADDVGPRTASLLATTVNTGNLLGLAGSASNLSPAPGYNQTRVTPDGTHFAFMSNSKALSESVAGYDNTDAVTGKPDFEVYRYDAEDEELSCVSCNPTGAQPRGILLRHPYNPIDQPITNLPDLRTAATIPTHEHDLHASRLLSDDGNRLFFHTDEALLPRDTNGVQDVYQWQAPGTGGCEVGQSDYFAQNDGCLSLISTGKDDAKSEFVDATPDGSEVFVSTDESLDRRDPGLRDIYVAKIDGGFPMPSADALCEGEACQTPPAPPDDPTPNSLSFQGPGNPAAQDEKPRTRCPKGKRRVKARGGKTRCVKRKRSTNKGAKSKRANNDRGASR